jgi:peptide/nickel transport system substrate-binding protein
MLDPRVRQALYRAVDKESWTEAILPGLRQNIAHSLLPPDHHLYEFTRDSLRSYQFEPDQALRMLGDAGWRRGSDGTVANQTEGRRFLAPVWVTQDAAAEAAILADMWKTVGIEPSIFIIPNPQVADRELRQSYPGVDISSRGYAEHILTRAECGTLAIPPRYAGANRGHYCSPQMDQLIENFRSSLTRADQGRWIGEIARYHAQELPVMQLYFRVSHPTIVRGLNALADDFSGGIQPSGYYGSYFRNAHLWQWT